MAKTQKEKPAVTSNSIIKILQMVSFVFKVLATFGLFQLYSILSFVINGMVSETRDFMLVRRSFTNKNQWFTVFSQFIMLFLLSFSEYKYT